MQTKWLSLAESLAGTAVGFGVALLSQLVIFPAFDIHVPMSDHLLIVLYFTVISVIRVYLMRRVFNKITVLERSVDKL